jgi:hypothetical protein
LSNFFDIGNPGSSARTGRTWFASYARPRRRCIARYRSKCSSIFALAALSAASRFRFDAAATSPPPPPLPPPPPGDSAARTTTRSPAIESSTPTVELVPGPGSGAHFSHTYDVALPPSRSALLT